MAIRGKSKTAQDPNSALKSRRKKKEEPAPKANQTIPSGDLPSGVAATLPTAPQNSSPTSGIFNALPQIPIPGLANPTSSTATVASTTGNRPAVIATARRDLANVEHGLELPQFNPNDWMARDLFQNTSPLPETSQAVADEAVLSIQRKRQTLRIAKENIGLNSDIVSVATDYQKLQGQVIDYATVLVDNQTKYVKYTDAGVKQQTAMVKLAQSQEQHTQETIALDGMRALTPLIQEDWNERRNLRTAKVNALREQTLRVNTDLERKRRELEVMFDITNFQTI